MFRRASVFSLSPQVAWHSLPALSFSPGSLGVGFLYGCMYTAQKGKKKDEKKRKKKYVPSNPPNSTRSRSAAASLSSTEPSKAGQPTHTYIYTHVFIHSPRLSVSVCLYGVLCKERASIHPPHPPHSFSGIREFNPIQSNPIQSNPTQPSSPVIVCKKGARKENV
ncbi:hypothetical protein IWZ01DRAFT_56534 [Phyllosticta capitalensis]